MEFFLILIIIVLVIILISRKPGNQDTLIELTNFNRKLDKMMQEIKLIQQKIDHSDYMPSSKVEEVKIAIDKPIISEVIHTIPEVIPEIKIEEEPIKRQHVDQDFISKIDKIVEDKVKYQQQTQALNQNPTPKREPIVLEPGFWDKFKANNPDMEKFIGENLIPKLGILILVLGISFFVKLAIDKDWITEVGRVGIGVLSGVILLGISHYLHKEYKAFSSVLVAGAITIFYFTIAYGFHKYRLYPQTVAFGIMVFITLFSTLVSIYYDRKELAILSVIGGFGVPFMVSNGEGNYIALFSYLMILNVGMLVLSYFKHWDIVKTLSFGFTYFIFGFWFSTRYPNIHDQAHFNTFLYINAFYLIYLTMNMVDILKKRSANIGFNIGFLMITTAITYFIAMDILAEFYPKYKGLYTLIMAIINLSSTYLVFKYAQEQKTMVYFMLGLTLLFATIAIPIQFDGYYVTIFWAVEAFLLIWISNKSNQNAFFTTSIIVYLLSLISLVLDWGHYNSGIIYPVIGNSIFLTGLVVNISIYAASYLLRRHNYKLPFMDQDKFDSSIFLIIGVILSYIIGMFEVNYQTNQYFGLMYSKNSILMIYHYIFTTIGVIYFGKMSNNRFLIALYLGVINVLLFIFFNAYQPFDEMSYAISSQVLSNLAFYANFVYVFCILIILFLMIKRYNEMKDSYIFERKYLISGLLIFIVFLLSNQLLMYYLKSNIQYISSYYTAHIDLKYKLYKVLFPIIWGVLSLIYLTYGIKNRIRPVRIISLALLLITIVKLFVYDIKNVSDGGRILAFILLGVLALIMSFMYQKIKKIILDESVK